MLSQLMCTAPLPSNNYFICFAIMDHPEMKPYAYSSLHLLLLRFTGGSLQKRTLRLRRAPDDVVLGLIQLDPRAAGVRDHNGMLPIHIAAREGHGIGVIDALLESFPGGAAERDGNHAFPIDLALDYACQNAKKTKRREGTAATETDDVEDEVDDPRWAVVKHLLLASPEAAVDSSNMESPEGKRTVLLLGALSKSAPESVVRMLIPPTAPYFSSRHGVNDASTALYLAIANRYPLDVMDQIASICPVQTRSIRDETGMGLVAASYVVWAYGDGSGKKKASLSDATQDGVAGNRSSKLHHWSKLKQHDDIMKSLIKAQASVSFDGPLSPPTSTEDVSIPDGFHDWWNKMKYWIQYYRFGAENSGASLPNSLDAFPEHLLHAALANPDTPPSVIFILLRLDIASAAISSVINDRLPLHIAAVTSPYTARHYEENQLPSSTMEIIYRAHPAAVRVRDPVTDRPPLHLALWDGQKTWNQGIAILAEAEPRSLNVKDWSSHNQNSRNEDTGDADKRAERDAPIGLYPFQMAAVARPPTEEMKLRFAYQARNRFSSAQWRGMTVRQKAAEVNKEEASHELDVLTTVFELLRAEPSAISDKKDDGGSVVKLLAMRWGAKSSKKGARTDMKSPNPNPHMKTSNQTKSEEMSLFPSSAMPTTTAQSAVDGDPFGNIHQSFSDFSEDSFGFQTSNVSALQFNVNSLGQGTVTEMPSNAAFDVSASIQEEQSGQLTMYSGGNTNTNDPISPSTADGGTPTGTALLSPEWFGNTAILSPQSQEPVASDTTTSSSDAVPQGFVDPHLAAMEESKTPKKKSPWFKVKSFNKSRRSTSGNDPSATSDIPQEFDVSDDYFCSTFSPEKTPRGEAQAVILASQLSQWNQGAIYNDWMNAYNVDRAEEEESRAFDSSAPTSALAYTASVRPRLDTEASSIANSASKGISKDVEISASSSSMLCVACSSLPKEILCLPCRHLCLCGGCAKRNTFKGCCPVCKRSVSSTVEVFY